MLQIAVNSCVSPKREIKPKLNQQIGPTKWVLLDNLSIKKNKTKYFIFIKTKNKKTFFPHIRFSQLCRTVLQLLKAVLPQQETQPVQPVQYHAFRPTGRLSCVQV